VQPGLQITAIRVTYSEHSEQHITHRLVSQSVSFGANWCEDFPELAWQQQPQNSIEKFVPRYWCPLQHMQLW